MKKMMTLCFAVPLILLVVPHSSRLEGQPEDYFDWSRIPKTGKIVYSSLPNAPSVTISQLDKSNFPIIEMYVDVLDAQNNPIPGLGQNDFCVYQDGAPVNFQVTEVGSAGCPTSISLVIDVSGSMGGTPMEDAKDAADHFVDNMDPFDRVGIVTFGVCANIRHGFTGNQTSLHNTISGLFGTETATAVFDGIWLGLDETATELGSKAVIAFTDGGENNSENCGYPPDGAYDVNSYHNDSTIICNKANAAGIPIYTIGFGSGAWDVPLIAFAEGTGGHYRFAPDGPALDSIYTEIKGHLCSRYFITYISPDTILSGDWHTARVCEGGSACTPCDEWPYQEPCPPVIVVDPATLALSNHCQVPNLALDICATVTDDCAPGLQDVTLYYRHSGELTYTSAPMTQWGVDHFCGIVPAGFIPVGTKGIDYYITASDGENTVSVPAANPQLYPLVISICPNDIPQISHTPPSCIPDGQNIAVSATIIDTINFVGRAALYYRTKGYVLYDSTVMTHSGGNSYYGMIPASYLTASGIDYIIRAWDNHGVMGQMGPLSPAACAGPQFAHPPTPICDSEFEVYAGDELSFDVEAFDPDQSDVCTLSVAGLPTGASMTPSLPRFGNPVVSAFSWTPNTTDTGYHAIVFTVTDSDGNSKECFFGIAVVAHVPAPPVFDLPPTPTCYHTFNIKIGQRLQFDVQTSDSDPSDEVTLSVTGLPFGASLIPPLPQTDNPVKTSFDWTPSSSQGGQFTIVFTATDKLDGLSTQCTFYVVVNRPPEFVFPPTPACGSMYTAKVGQLFCFTARAYDSDPSDQVTLSVSGLPWNGPSPVTGNPAEVMVCGTPAESDVGTYTVSLTATDNQGTSTQCSFYVNVPQLQGPEFVHPPTPTCDEVINVVENHQITFTVTASDPAPSDLCTLSVDGTLPAGASVSPNLPRTGNPVTTTFSWTPTAAHRGTHSVTFRVADTNDGLDGYCTIRIYVGREKYSPEFVHPPTPDCDTLFEIGSTDTLAFNIEAYDPDPTDGVILTASLPNGATITPNPPVLGNPVVATFTWIPPDTGSYEIILTATDTFDGYSAECTIYVKVARYVVPPEFTEPQCGTTFPVHAVTEELTFNVEAFDQWPADQVMINVTLPSGATASPPLPTDFGNPVTTTFSWIPDASQVGVHTVVFIATDQLDGLSAQCTVYIEVEPPVYPPEFDHPPTPACDTTFVIETNKELGFNVQASDPWPGDQVTLTATLPPGAQTFPDLMPPYPFVKGNPVTLSFSWAPDNSQVGNHTVTFTATDELDGLTKQCRFYVEVTEASSPEFVVPVTGCGITDTIEVFDTFTLDIEVFDPWPDEEVTLTASGLPSSAELTPTLPSTGNPVQTTLSWVPGYPDTGTHTIVFTATDDIDGLSAECVFVIVVKLPPLEFSPTIISEGDSIMIDDEVDVWFNVSINPAEVNDSTFNVCIGGNTLNCSYQFLPDELDDQIVRFRPVGWYPPLSTVTVNLSGMKGIHGEGLAPEYPHTLTYYTRFGVHPGDLDNNGDVDIDDVVQIAEHWRTSGPARYGSGLGWRTWGMKPSMGWEAHEATYADADGDGIVDENDLFPIGRHWQKTHGYGAESVSSFHPEYYQEELQALYDAIKHHESPFMEKVKNYLEGLLKVDAVPREFWISQNYPNPFNATTSIAFYLPESDRVRLAIINSLGQQVRLLDQRTIPPGRYKYAWDGRDDNGRSVASGVYFFQLTGELYTGTRKMTMLK